MTPSDGSRFGQYSDSDWPELRKLEPGESFTARLLGAHEYVGEDATVPVLECVDDDGEFGWRAGAWQARKELAAVDPQDGDVIRVERLANVGRSHRYAIRVVSDGGR